jgi:hypothetical protein
MPDPSNISIARVTPTSCRPFLLEVMVFSPEAGHKFELSVERSCIKATNGELPKTKWKLVFDLFKQKAGSSEFDHLVHVSYTAENETQEKNLALTAANGVSQAQAKQVITKVHPAVKDVVDVNDLPQPEADKRKQKVKKEMSKVTIDL